MRNSPRFSCLFTLHPFTVADPVFTRVKAPLWEHQEIESRILYQDDELLAFNKPYDWPTSGYTLNDDDCVQFHLINYLRESGTISPTSKYPRGMAWAVHQLDADTSGLLLFALSKRATKRAHRALTASGTTKTYNAYVQGAVPWDHHIESSPMGVNSEGIRDILSLSDGGKDAKTEFHTIARTPQSSALRIQLHTGRTHQIRIHLSYLGHPLIGEEWYTPCPLHSRQALHAAEIHSPDLPTLLAPLPPDLCGLAKKFHLPTNFSLPSSHSPI